jgi:putative DNA primase/helicase
MGYFSEHDIAEKNARDGIYAEGDGESAGLSHDILSLEHLLYRFGGAAASDGRGILCPGPDHSAADRSMSITIDPSAPDGVLINSFSSRTSAAECWKYFWDTLAPDIEEATAAMLAATDNPEDMVPVAMNPRPVVPKRSIAEKIAYARSKWDQASSTIGSPALAYLESRRLHPLGSDVMRYRQYSNWAHPDDPADRKKRECAPELIMAFRNILTGEFQTIHRTRLPHIGPKPQRCVHSPIPGGAIMLTPYAEVMAAGEVAISEGWESGLAAMRLGEANVWSVFNSGGVQNFPVLDGIRSLTILAEHNDANKAAREICRRRWRDAGREVFFSLPEHGDDFNDELMEATL